jgi:hypothetical protein
MAAVDTGSAALTLTDMNVELPMDGLSWNFCLVLGHDLGFDNVFAPAVRALGGKRYVVVLVDRAGNPAVGVSTMSLTRLPTRFFGVCLWSICLPKWGSLTLGAALRFLQGGLQLLDGRSQLLGIFASLGEAPLQLADLSPQSGILGFEFAPML